MKLSKLFKLFDWYTRFFFQCCQNNWSILKSKVEYPVNSTDNFSIASSGLLTLEAEIQLSKSAFTKKVCEKGYIRWSLGIENLKIQLKY